jgi:hypothetical protein
MVLQYFTTNTSVELVCLISALVSLGKSRLCTSWFIILFLLITVTTEMVAIPIKIHYLKDTKHNLPNIWLYNLLLIVQVAFYNIIFAALLNKKIYRNPILFIFLPILFGFYVYEISVHGLFEYNELTNSIFSTEIVLCSLVFYYDLFKSDLNIKLGSYSDFWFVTGILFFFFGSTVLNLFYGIIKQILPNNKHFVGYIYNALNILLYGFWSYSFICKRWLTPTLTV